MVSSSQLPRGDSPNLALVQPTEEEKLIQFKLNSVQWRGALSLDAYLRREEVLASQELTQHGGITFWILVDTSNHNALDPASKARLPLASCESYRKRALVWREGKVQEIIAHGIGGVFCAPHLRKRGYAARMMKELAKTLETYQAEEKEALFSILFSDIGKSFYAKHGWEPFNSAHISIPGTVKDVEGLPTAYPLYEEDLEELCVIDEELMRRRLESRRAGSNVAVAIVPDIQTIRWHHARENFVGKELHGKAPKVKGAMVGSEKGKRIWCYWTRMWYNDNPNEAKGNTLHILRVVMEDERQQNAADAIAALLAMAQQETQEWKMAEVEAWNPSEAVTAAAQKLYPSAKVIDRDTESIASLRWHPPHTGRVADSIDWVGNEKYVWC
jgi:hypothetical protein